MMCIDDFQNHGHVYVSLTQTHNNLECKLNLVQISLHSVQLAYAWHSEYAGAT